MLKDVPVGRGYVDLLAAVSLAQGPMARLEAGARPLENLAAFAFAEARRGDAAVGVGMRWTF